MNLGIGKASRSCLPFHASGCQLHLPQASGCTTARRSFLIYPFGDSLSLTDLKLALTSSLWPDQRDGVAWETLHHSITASSLRLASSWSVNHGVNPQKYQR